jgi:hypothetical protein
MDIKLLKKLFTVGLFFLALLLSSNLYATHIRAGEITAVRISSTSLTYEFTITAYTDTGSEVLFGAGEINFGDGTKLILVDNANFSETTVVGDEIASNIFKINHTFQAPGKYTISYTERNRNAGVKNMANSVDTPFYVETKILIDPFLGINNTPVFLVPPVDQGAVGALFIHNPGAFDIDGDSLSYSLVIPKQAVGTVVFDFLLPNHPDYYASNIYEVSNEAQDGLPTFDIDSIRGDLIWDAPGLLGEYNTAFVVNEWRKVQGEWFNLGSVTRDMQIIIEETDNERPEVVIPEEICVEAGTLITEEIIGLDPDGQDVKLEAFGGPLQLPINPATYLPFPPVYQPQPGTLDFSWKTDCDQVRERPYEIQFKVTDKPEKGPKLVDFKTLPIRIVGSAPTGLAVTVIDGKTMRLDWDNFDCGSADKMQIWRRVDTFDFIPDNCEIGLPEYAGYDKIATVDSIKYLDSNNVLRYKTSFIDNNGGVGLSPGANFCYRIVAQYPEPAGGESYASEEACEIIKADVPIILNVDIKITDQTNGEVFVRWLEPYEIDQAQFPPPYTYEVIRGENFLGNTNEISLGITSSTQFTDVVDLNTFNKVYNYKIRILDAGDNFVGVSSSASTLRLAATPLLNAIELTWEATTPWSNQIQDHPLHRIFRDQVDPSDPTRLVQIALADVSTAGLFFLDDGTFNAIPLSDAIEYCYYVEAKGGYGNANIPEPLINASQITCAQPNDVIPPCTPLAFTLDNTFSCEEALVNSQNCSFNNFSNKLIWKLNLGDFCQDDVTSFNVYFSEDGNDNYELLDNVNGLQYNHIDLNSFKGCYKIASVDRSDNESELSESVCNDNCPNFKMPNAFSPNGDGINDLFTSMIDNVDGKRISNFQYENCPRFVESVEFKVFDRNGAEIFHFNSDDSFGEGIGSTLINWDGKNNAGVETPAGLYYYSADVIFDVLDANNRLQNFNGWVQLLK